jgi:hypothetical protein
MDRSTRLYLITEIIKLMISLLNRWRRKTDDPISVPPAEVPVSDELRRSSDREGG